MRLIEKLKNRLRTKTEGTSATYWGALTKAAGQDSLSERAMELLIESVEGFMVELGKSVDDVQKDFELVSQLADLEDAPAALENARAEAQELHAEADEKARQSDEHHAEHLRLKQEAEEARNKAQNGQQAAAQRMAQHRELSARLAAAGHPDFLVASAAGGKAREVKRLFGELRSLDLGPCNGESAGVAGQMPHLAARAARRRQVCAKLATLGVRVDSADVSELERIDADLEQRERERSKNRDQESEKCLAELRVQRRQVVTRLLAAEAAR